MGKGRPRRGSQHRLKRTQPSWSRKNHWLASGLAIKNYGPRGRSLQDLVGFLSELHALKIDLFLRQQGLDTTTPAGKAMFQMMGVFAEFEPAMIQERVRARPRAGPG
jgi:Resolvase, N terminal domain